MSLSNIDLEQILLTALESPIGIVVATNDADLLKKQCYSVRNAARKELNTAYDALSFKTSPTAPDTELWIVKKSGD